MKYYKKQWLIAEETYKHTGSYVEAAEKSGIPRITIKKRSERKNWKPEKDEQVAQVRAEIKEEIKQETKKEIKTVLTKSREVQEKAEEELPKCENATQKAALMNVMVKAMQVEGKITKELVESVGFNVQVEMKPLLGGASVATVKDVSNNNSNKKDTKPRKEN